MDRGCRTLACAALLAVAATLPGCATLCRCGNDAASELSSRLAGSGPARIDTRASLSVKTIELRRGSVTLIQGSGDYVEPIYRTLAGEDGSGIDSLGGWLLRFLGILRTLPSDADVYVFRRGDTVGWATGVDERELRVLREWASDGRTVSR
jgi:hypothetical protein